MRDRTGAGRRQRAAERVAPEFGWWRWRDGMGMVPTYHARSDWWRPSTESSSTCCAAGLCWCAVALPTVVAMMARAARPAEAAQSKSRLTSASFLDGAPGRGHSRAGLLRMGGRVVNIPRTRGESPSFRAPFRLASGIGRHHCPCRGPSPSPSVPRQTRSATLRERDGRIRRNRVQACFDGGARASSRSRPRSTRPSARSRRRCS